MLNGAVKRLRTTNQLKEGMERVIIDQRKIIDLLPVYVETNFSDMINKSAFFCPTSSVSYPRSVEESQGEFRGEFTTKKQSYKMSN